MRALTLAMCAAALLTFAVACEGPRQTQIGLAQAESAGVATSRPNKSAAPQQKG